MVHGTSVDFSMRLNADQLFSLAERILTAAGAPESDAKAVASDLSESNLLGHDSHGVMRLMQYVQFIHDGHIKPGAGYQVLSEAASLVLVDGQFGFGQVSADAALQMAITKARETGCGSAYVRNCNHVGRLGRYTETAAREGMAAVMAVNAPGPGQVTPFGACERRMGTNPISMAAPGRINADGVDGQPIVLDMTTSATAEGKLRVAHQSGDSIPEGWLIDSEGRPTTNPGDYYADPGGCIVSLGGPLAHKGFGLSVMVDLFAGVLSGSGVARTDLPRGANGVWINVVDISQLLPAAEYDEWLVTYRAHIKSAKRLAGVEEILFPGEIESRRRLEREQVGVELPAETWRQIDELALSLECDLSDLTEG